MLNSPPAVLHALPRRTGAAAPGFAVIRTTFMPANGTVPRIVPPPVTTGTRSALPLPVADAVAGAAATMARAARTSAAVRGARRVLSERRARSRDGRRRAGKFFSVSGVGDAVR